MKISTKKLAVTGIFAAIASVLMFLNFPVPLMPPFIKFDFSELPALLISFAYGPLYGIVVCFIKNLVNFPFSTASYVGVLSNFLLGVLFVVPAGLIYSAKKNRSRALLGLISGTVLMSLGSIFTNYYIIYPFYQTLMPIDAIMGEFKKINPNADGLLSAILMFNFPFNLVKGSICSIITFIVYKKLSPILKDNML